MRDNLRAIFSLYKEAVIAVSDDKITMQNPSAEKLFGDVSLQDPRVLLPESVLSCAAEKFTSTALVRGTPCCVTCVTLDDTRIYTIMPFADDALRHKLLSSVGIRLREKIAEIKVASDILRPYVENTDEAKIAKYHQIITKSSYSLHRMVGNMTFFSAYDKGDFSPEMVDLNARLSLIPDSVSAFCDKSIEYVPYDGTLTAYVDYEKIEMAVFQLLLNSLKATGDDGKIKIAAYPSGDNIVVEVADNGPGIAEDRLASLWSIGENFDTANPSGIGTGLPIVRCIAQLHGGNAILITGKDAGTRVMLVLPITGSHTHIIRDVGVSYDSGLKNIMVQLADAIPYDRFSSKFMD